MDSSALTAPRSVLIVRLSALGDAVHVLPVADPDDTDARNA